MTTRSKLSPRICSLALLVLTACGSSSSSTDGAAKKDATADTRGSDALVAEAGADGATPDASIDASLDATRADTAPADAAAPDSAPADTRPADAAAPDAAAPDVPRDAATPDAATPDAASPDGEEPEPDAAVGGGRDVGADDVALEAEVLDHTPHGANADEIDDAMSSGGKYLLLTGTKVGDGIDFTFDNVPAGDYEISLDWTADDDRAIVALSVDGHRVGDTLDQYAGDVSHETTAFGNVTLAAGEHTIHLEATGKNAASGNFAIATDRFLFIKQ
jgi:hypothetical protein